MTGIPFSFSQYFSNVESLKKLRDFRRNSLLIFNIICYTVHGADPFCMAMMWHKYIIPYVRVCIYYYA